MLLLAMCCRLFSCVVDCRLFVLRQLVVAVCLVCWCSLRVDCWLVVVVRCVVLVVFCVVIGVCCMSCGVSCSRCVAFFASFVVYCLQSVVRCLLFVA